MIITVAHQKGGTGKSTLAVNIAGLLGADMLDLDKQHSSALWNHMRSLTEHIPLRLCVLESSGCQLPSVNVIKEDDYTKYLKAYQHNPEALLVIDTGGFDSPNNRLAIAYADMVVTPVSPSGIEIFGLQNFEKILQEANELLETPVRAYVLVNNYQHSSVKRLNELQDFVSNRETFALLNSKIHRRIGYQRAYEDGLLVTELKRNESAKSEIKALIHEIKALL